MKNIITSGYKTILFKLNNRVRIKIEPISEYTYIRGYSLILQYKVISRVFRNYIWVDVNEIEINGEIDINSPGFKEKIKVLLKKRSIEKNKVNKEIYQLKKAIKEIYKEKE